MPDRQQPINKTSRFARLSCLASLLCLGFALTSTSYAQPHNSAVMDIKTIQQQALAFAQSQLASTNPGSRIVFETIAVDPRLKLAACSIPLTFEPQKVTQGSGRLLIKTRCESDNSWSIYIPLYKHHWQQSVVSNKPLRRNSVISSADVSLQEVKLSSTQQNVYTRVDDVVGLVSLRNIKSGQALQSKLLAPPKWVKRGDQVSIEAHTNGIKVSMTGTALTDGRSNEQIRVRNDRSKRVIKAKVVGPGRVKAII